MIAVLTNQNAIDLNLQILWDSTPKYFHFNNSAAYNSSSKNDNTEKAERRTNRAILFLITMEVSEEKKDFWNHTKLELNNLLPKFWFAPHKDTCGEKVKVKENTLKWNKDCTKEIHCNTSDMLLTGF